MRQPTPPRFIPDVIAAIQCLMGAAHAYTYALAANVSFAIASLIYAHFSQRISAYWMNALKAWASFWALLILILAVGEYREAVVGGITGQAMAAFALSGFLGLNIGDLFLLSAFVRLGPARTLMIFGFQPILLAAAGWLLFDQAMVARQFWALLFLVGCLGLFSFEGWKKTGRWEWWGLASAALGMSLDGVGVLLSRWAFDFGPVTGGAPISPTVGNFIRTAGAVSGFFVMGFIWPLKWRSHLRALPPRQLSLLLVGALLGTLVSLTFYLEAVRTGQLALVSGVAVTGPIFAAILECASARVWPSGYLMGAFALFLVGFFLLL